jgi:pyruvate/2-oxoglutarate dehydrogenase complex dihydrolipoamide dehydrogenase (E3) component
VSKILEPDLCVIGGGSGGLSVAAAAAALGVPTVLIEKAAWGGDCLNFGCVPSKSLLAAAAVADAQRNSDPFGIRAHEPRVDAARLYDHIKGVIAAISANDRPQRFAALGLTVLQAMARFTSRDVVEADRTQIKARRFIIATGSSPGVPAIAGLELVRFLTNETIFELRELPTRLVVLGAGATGIELAQAFRRLGVDVIVLDSGRALAREDPELAAPLIDRLVREGIEFREGVDIFRIEPRHGAGVRVYLKGEVEQQGEPIDGSHILLATGRKANVEGLGLEAAHIIYDAMGIKVSRSLRSVSNRKVYAVGDVAAIDGVAPARYTHVANYHAGIVIQATAFRLRARVAPDVLPRVIYSDPELASVGLSEEEGRRQHGSIRVLRWPFAENDRARTGRRTTGHIKVITTKRGLVLGAGIVGASAGELITPWTLAIKQGLNISALADIVVPYPTLSEISRRAAFLSLAPRLANPWVATLLRALRSFG